MQANFAELWQRVAHVDQTLAGYKKPKVILILPDLQRSPSGKIDMTALKKKMVP